MVLMDVDVHNPKIGAGSVESSAAWGSAGGPWLFVNTLLSACPNDAVSHGCQESVQKSLIRGAQSLTGSPNPLCSGHTVPTNTHTNRVQRCTLQLLMQLEIIILLSH